MNRLGLRLALAAVASGVLATCSLLVATTTTAQVSVVSGSTSDPAAGTEVGRSLFQARCGMCHLAGGTGTFMLGRRLGAANALLVERTNLDATYVKHVVRNGIVSMPRITRAEVSDAELLAIVDYLTRKRGAREQGTGDEGARRDAGKPGSEPK